MTILQMDYDFYKFLNDKASEMNIHIEYAFSNMSLNKENVIKVLKSTEESLLGEEIGILKYFIANNITNREWAGNKKPESILSKIEELNDIHIAFQNLQKINIDNLHSINLKNGLYLACGEAYEALIFPTLGTEEDTKIKAHVNFDTIQKMIK